MSRGNKLYTYLSVAQFYDVVASPSADFFPSLRVPHEFNLENKFILRISAYIAFVQTATSVDIAFG